LKAILATKRVLLPFFGDELTGGFVKHFWSARFTDIFTYRWTPAEYLRRISATFLLRLSGHVSGGPRPASTYLYPKTKDIQLTLTPTLRKLYDYRKEEEEEVQDTTVSRSSLASPQKACQKEQDCLKRHQEDGSL
jgi:hypothetical protein